MNITKHLEVTITLNTEEELRLFKKLCESLVPGGSRDIPHLTTTILYSTDGTRIKKMMEEMRDRLA